MDTEPVTSPRRKQELTILTSYSESVFLLASQISIGRKPVELLPAPVGRGYVLQCEWPYFQLPFEEVLTPVAELLQSCGASRVGKFWSEPSPVFDVDFDSQASIQQMIESLESGQVREGMELIILSLTQSACSPANPDAIPEWKLDIGLELLQVLPNADTKDAIIHRVSSTNRSMCVHLWNERKVFDVGALLRWYRSKPLGGESPAASGDVTLLDLVRELKEVVGWMRLGLQLGVPKHTLETIRCQYAMHGVDMCKIEMLSTWLDGHTEEPTWAEVVSAVSRTGNKRVARRIADKYGLALAILMEANSFAETSLVAMGTIDPLEPIRRDMEGTHRAMEDNESQMQLCTRKKRKLEGDLAETHDNCDIVRKYTEMLTKDKESLQQRLEERENEIRSLQSKQLEYERKICDLEVKLAIAGAKAKQKLKDKLKHMRQEKEELVECIASKQEEVSKLTKKMSKLCLKLECAKTELSAARSRLKLKTSQVDEIQQQLHLVREQRDELEERLKVQEKAMEEVVMRHVESDEAASKVGELQLKTSQLDEVEQQLQLVRDQRDELNEQLKVQEKATEEAVMQHVESDKVASKAREKDKKLPLWKKWVTKSREKDKRYTNLLSQMELWESEMADECKRAFIELQMDPADLDQISAADKNLPYRDFHSFAMHFLFPRADHTHPVLQPLALPSGVDREAVSRQLASFRDLIMDKKFLLVFVRTLEDQQGRFSLQDRCNVASLLMVVFQNDLDYASEILLTLLSDLIRKTITRSDPKLFLRSTQSIAEKMLANWLCFLLFPYVQEHVGEPLFILYRAIKQQLEKGPVDVITGEARRSLSEEKLLRQHIDFKAVEGVVETDSGEEVPIKLLDCDSITQSKEKILDAVYKNVPISRRPQLADVDLELRRANAGIPLRDQDQTNTKDGEWIKVNTLGHYRLAEMSQAWEENKKNPQPRFKLVQRTERPLSGMSFDTLGTILANMNTPGHASILATAKLSHVYHLVKPGDQGEEGPQQGAKIMSEVFLTRLLSTKRILQPYVDDLFHAIFAMPRGKPLSLAVKYLFDFLDLQASELGIQDPEILHIWKNNSLPLRFWMNLIKNPDFVFDINKSATVDACLTVIAQAYIDGCSTTELRYTKDTPSGQLLYVNEVKSYQHEVQEYYNTIQSLPKLDGHEMQEYLRETVQMCASSVPAGAVNDVKATTCQLYFQPESALFELFQFAVEYHQDIDDALNEEGLAHLCVSFRQIHQVLTKAGCISD